MGEQPTDNGQAAPPRRGIPVYVWIIIALVLLTPLGLGLAGVIGVGSSRVEEEAAATAVVATEVAIEAEAIPEDPWGFIEIGPDQHLRIAVNVVLTAPGINVIGISQLNAVEIAAAEWRHVIAERRIRTVPNETLCSAEGGIVGAQNTIADPSIIGVIGHTCSSSCETAIPIYDEAHFTMISPSCTTSYLTDPDGSRAFMRTAVNDNFQATAAAEFAYNELGVTRAAMVDDGSGYAQGLVDTFAARFMELGGEIVAEQRIEPDSTDMFYVLEEFSAADAELIYMPLRDNDAGILVAQAFEGSVAQGLHSFIFIGSDVTRGADLLAHAGEAAEGIYVTAPDWLREDELTPEYEEFQVLYKRIYQDEPAIFALESYDAANMLLKAVEAVMIEQADGSLLIGRKALRDALYATAEMQGLSGTIACDPYGDCGDRDIPVLVIRNGEYVETG